MVVKSRQKGTAICEENHPSARSLSMAQARLVQAAGPPDGSAESLWKTRDHSTCPKRTTRKTQPRMQSENMQ